MTTGISLVPCYQCAPKLYCVAEDEPIFCESCAAEKARLPHYLTTAKIANLLDTQKERVWRAWRRGWIKATAFIDHLPLFDPEALDGARRYLEAVKQPNGVRPAAIKRQRSIKPTKTQIPRVRVSGGTR
jgi:hypothetical protein